MSLRDQLSPCVRLRFPGFEKQYRFEEKTGLGETRAYYFEPVDCRKWYRQIVDRIVQAVDDKSYLPLYRMGDGEFSFALETPHEEIVPFWKLSWKEKLSLALKYLMGRSGDHRAGFSGEYYNAHERKNVHDEFVDGVRHIAEKGILCPAFHTSPLYRYYFPEIFDWFDSNNIPLDPSNYLHVYGIYALINGPDADRLLAGRDVLVATSLSEHKKRRIRKGLQKHGVETIQFLEVSEHQAMLDRVDPSVVTRPIDLVLIAAGVGACNVIRQMKSLRVPQLDIGFCIDTIARPELRWKRPFCIPDDDFDAQKVEYVPEHLKKGFKYCRNTNIMGEIK